MNLRLEYGRPDSVEGRYENEIRVYDFLDQLKIPYERVDHPRTDTMEACSEIDGLLQADICKNLFLCNRQKTKFYLLMMPGSKKFRTKDLSGQIGSSRLSFAGPEEMQKYLGLEPGSVSVLGLMNDRENKVRLLVDEELLRGKYIGCHPCVNTSSLKLGTQDVFEVFLKATGHEMTTVRLPDIPQNEKRETRERTVRLVKAEESEILRNIYQQYIDTNITFEYDLPSREEFSARIEEVLKEYPFFVCEKDGRILGYAYAHRQMERAAYQWNVELTVYLDKDARGQGIGTMLYQKLLDTLQKQGVRNAYSLVTCPNKASEKLHESMGFTKIGILKQTGYKNGRWLDVSWYEKKLNPFEPDPGKLKNYRDFI